MNLTQKKCVACEGEATSLSKKEISILLKEVSTWRIKNGHIYKQFKFKNFLESMKFINAIAEIAEQEGHHPNFCVCYNKVDIELWTHAINGLSENDFIVAAKIDKI